VEKDKFSALLPVIVGALASKIIKEKNISDEDAFNKLYISALYTALENEKTKVWQYSIPKLYELWENEAETGQLLLPEY
jgi:hypothetical protein